MLSLFRLISFIHLRCLRVVLLVPHITVWGFCFLGCTPAVRCRPLPPPPAPAAAARQPSTDHQLAPPTRTNQRTPSSTARQRPTNQLAPPTRTTNSHHKLALWTALAVAARQPSTDQLAPPTRPPPVHQLTRTDQRTLTNSHQPLHANVL